MQYLVHDDEQVVTAPLRVGRHELCHDLVNLLDNVHPQQFLKFDLARGYDCPNDLKSGGVELSMTDLKVLKEDLDKAELFENKHESGVTLNDD